MVIPSLSKSSRATLKPRFEQPYQMSAMVDVAQEKLWVKRTKEFMVAPKRDKSGPLASILLTVKPEELGMVCMLSCTYSLSISHADHAL